MCLPKTSATLAVMRTAAVAGDSTAVEDAKALLHW